MNRHALTKYRRGAHNTSRRDAHSSSAIVRCSCRIRRRIPASGAATTGGGTADAPSPAHGLYV
jgi:hypothetical protein